MIPYSIAFVAFFFSLVLAPCPMFYKLLFSSCMLLLVDGKKIVKYTSNHRLFLVWMVWITICCVFSAYPYISFIGYHLRVEGLLTWVVMAALAYFYWTVFETHLPMIGLCAGILILSLFGLTFLPQEQFYLIGFTPVALASICCVFSVLLWSASPPLVLLMIPLLIYSNSRSAVIGSMAGIGLFILMKSANWKKILLYSSSALIAMAILIQFTPLKAKFANIKPSAIGKGARAHWIKEGAKMTLTLPVTGLGLDTLGKYLTEAPDADYRHVHAICDKTHFFLLDIILMTGWIGFLIFLFMAYSSIKTTLAYQSDRNITCLCVMAAWAVFGCFNPQGCYSTMLAIWAFMGVRKELNEC